MKRVLLAFAVFLGMAAGSAPAWADMTYTLNCSDAATCGPSINFGTVKLHQASSTDVTVTVSLANNVHFTATGAGFAIGFDLKNNPSLNVVDGIKIDTVNTVDPGNFSPQAWTSGQSYKLAPFTQGGNGDPFQYAIEYIGGNSNTQDVKLVFDVNLSTGISINDFIGNPNFLFATDIFGSGCPNGNTCDVGVRVPEPATLAMSFAGLLGLIGFTMVQRRRKSVYAL